VAMTKDAGKFTVEIDGNTIKIYRSDTLGAEFPSGIKYNVTDTSGNTQSQTLHTSCSQQLNVGDQFGSLILRRFIPKGSSVSDVNAIYTYMISHTGADDVVVDVADKHARLISDNLVIWPGVTEELTIGATLAEDVTNVVKVEDTAIPAVCGENTDTVTVKVLEPPAACTSETKVGEITLEYTGDPCSATTNLQGGKFICSGDMIGEPVEIVITKDADKVTASPNSVILAGDLVTFTHKDGKLAADTMFNAVGPYGTQSLSIHTSCSKPLAEGDQFGSMKVVDLVLIPK